MEGRGSDWTVAGGLRPLPAPVALRLPAADTNGTADQPGGKPFPGNGTGCGDAGDMLAMKPLDSSYAELSPAAPIPGMFDLPWDGAGIVPGDPLAVLPSLLDLDDAGSDIGAPAMAEMLRETLQTGPLSDGKSAVDPSGDGSSYSLQPVQDDLSDDATHLEISATMEADLCDELWEPPQPVGEEEGGPFSPLPTAVGSADQLVSSFLMQSAELSEDGMRDCASNNANSGQETDTPVLPMSLDCPLSHDQSLQTGLLLESTSNGDSLQEEAGEELDTSGKDVPTEGVESFESKSSTKIDSTGDHGLGNLSLQATNSFVYLKEDSGHSLESRADQASGVPAGLCSLPVGTAADLDPLSPVCPKDSHCVTGTEDHSLQTPMSVDSRQELELESEVSPSMGECIREHEEDMKKDGALDQPDVSARATSSPSPISDRHPLALPKNRGSDPAAGEPQQMSNIPDDSVVETQSSDPDANSRPGLSNLEPGEPRGSPVGDSRTLLSPPVQYSEDSNESFSSGESVLLISDLELSDDEEKKKPSPREAEILLQTETPCDEVLEEVKPDSVEQDESQECLAEGTQSGSEEPYILGDEFDVEGSISEHSEDSESKDVYSSGEHSPTECLPNEQADSTCRENQELCTTNAVSLCLDQDESKLSEMAERAKERKEDAAGLGSEALEGEMITEEELDGRDSAVSADEHSIGDEVGEILDAPNPSAEAVEDDLPTAQEKGEKEPEGREEPIDISDSDDTSCLVAPLEEKDEPMDCTPPDDADKDTAFPAEETVHDNPESGSKAGDGKKSQKEEVFVIDDEPEPEVITLGSSDEEEEKEKEKQPRAKPGKLTMSLRPRKSPPAKKEPTAAAKKEPAAAAKKEPAATAKKETAAAKSAQWACHLCGETRPSLALLKAHVRKVHNLIMVHQREAMKCKLCLFRGNWQEIKKHIIQEHQTPLKWYIKNHMESREITKLPSSPAAAAKEDVGDGKRDRRTPAKPSGTSKMATRQHYLIKKMSNTDRPDEVPVTKVATTATGCSTNVITTALSVTKVVANTVHTALTTASSVSSTKVTTSTAVKMMAMPSVSAPVKTTSSPSAAVHPNKVLQVSQTGIVRLPLAPRQQLSLVPTSRNPASVNSFVIIHQNGTSTIARTTQSLTTGQNNLSTLSSISSTQVVVNKTAPPVAKQGQQGVLVVSSASRSSAPGPTCFTINTSAGKQRVVQVPATAPQAVSLPVLYRTSTGPQIHQPVVTGSPGVSVDPTSGQTCVLVAPKPTSYTGAGAAIPALGNAQAPGQTFLRLVTGKSVLNATGEQPFQMSAAKALLNAICKSTGSSTDINAGVIAPTVRPKPSGLVESGYSQDRITTTTATTSVVKAFKSVLSSTPICVQSNRVIHVPPPQPVQAVSKLTPAVTQTTQSCALSGTSQKPGMITKQLPGSVVSREIVPKITLQHASDTESLATYLIKVPKQLTDRGGTPPASSEKEDADSRSFLVKIPVNLTNSPKKFMVHLPSERGSSLKHTVCIVQPPKAETGKKGTDIPMVVGKVTSSVPSKESKKGVPPQKSGGIIPTFNEDGVPGLLPLCPTNAKGYLSKKAEFLANLQEVAVDIKLLEAQFMDTKVFRAADLIKVDERVQYECARCKEAFPNLMLLQLHHIDCSTHPPSGKVLPIVHVPTALLAAFFMVSASGYSSVCAVCKLLILGSARNVEDQQDFASHLAKHAEPLVAITCLDDTRKLGILQTRSTSQQAREWVDYIVPPFKMQNKPTSSLEGTLEEYVCTEGILHHESLKSKKRQLRHIHKHPTFKVPKRPKDKLRDAEHVNAASKDHTSKPSKSTTYQSSLKVAEGCEGEWIEPVPKNSAKLLERKSPRPGSLKESIMKSPPQLKVTVPSIQARIKAHSRANYSKRSERVSNVKIPGRRSLRGTGLDFGQGLAMLPMNPKSRKRGKRTDAQDPVSREGSRKPDTRGASPSLSSAVASKDAPASTTGNKKHPDRQKPYKTQESPHSKKECSEIIVISSSDEEANDDDLKSSETCDAQELRECKEEVTGEAAGEAAREAAPTEEENMDGSLSSDSTDDRDVDDESSSEAENAALAQSDGEDSDAGLEEMEMETTQADIPLTMMALHYRRLNEVMDKSDEEDKELTQPDLSESVVTSDSPLPDDATGSQSPSPGEREDMAEKSVTPEKMMPSPPEDDGSRSSAKSSSDDSNLQLMHDASDRGNDKEASRGSVEPQPDETDILLLDVDSEYEPAAPPSENPEEMTRSSEKEKQTSLREDIDGDPSSEECTLQEITSDSLSTEVLAADNSTLEVDVVIDSCSEAVLRDLEPTHVEDSPCDGIAQIDAGEQELEENLSKIILDHDQDDGTWQEQPPEGSLLKDGLLDGDLLRGDVFLNTEEGTSAAEVMSVEADAPEEELCRASPSQEDSGLHLPEDLALEKESLNDVILIENSPGDNALEAGSAQDSLLGESFPEAPAAGLSSRDLPLSVEGAPGFTREITIADDSRRADALLVDLTVDQDVDASQGDTGSAESGLETGDVLCGEDSGGGGFSWDLSAKTFELFGDEDDDDDDGDILCVVDGSDDELEESLVLPSTDPLLGEGMAAEDPSLRPGAGTEDGPPGGFVASTDAAPWPSAKDLATKDLAAEQESQPKTLKRKSPSSEDGDRADGDLKRSRDDDSWLLMDVAGEDEEGEGSSDTDRAWTRDSSPAIFPHEDVGQVRAGGL